MQVIDLRSAEKFRIGTWYFHYLAWQASTPRNDIELRLERPAPPDGSGWCASDCYPTQQLGVDKGYPSDPLSVWWVILCLDGAPERMQWSFELHHHAPEIALPPLESAEQRFRDIIAEVTKRRIFQPAVQVWGSWRDGVLLGYEHVAAVLDMVAAVHASCAALNEQESLPWTQQFHIRAGIGRTVREAFWALLHARRDQACCAAREVGKPPLRLAEQLVTRTFGITV